MSISSKSLMKYYSVWFEDVNRNDAPKMEHEIFQIISISQYSGYRSYTSLSGVFFHLYLTEDECTILKLKFNCKINEIQTNNME